MARIGYGAEIVEIIKAIPQEDPIRTMLPDSLSNGSPSPVTKRKPLLT